jgi:hypothetical protein
MVCDDGAQLQTETDNPGFDVMSGAVNDSG